MKKILLLLILLSIPVFAYSIDINKYQDFLKTLKLSDKQIQKIDKIEAEYNPQIVKLNSQIILNNMHCAQLKINCEKINSSSRTVQNELQDLVKQKEKETLRVLKWSQKRKYKRYINNY